MESIPDHARAGFVLRRSALRGEGADRVAQIGDVLGVVNESDHVAVEPRIPRGHEYEQHDLCVLGTTDLSPDTAGVGGGT